MDQGVLNEEQLITLKYLEAQIAKSGTQKLFFFSKKSININYTNKITQHKN